MAEPVDLRTRVGGLELPNPVMTAAGTAGHGAELAPYLDLAGLGAHVVKSLAPYAWPGNPAPRLAPLAATASMLNSVGLQGPGVEAWLEHDLPALERLGVRVVASVWGRTVADYRKAAELLADAPAAVVAVEVNVSCPNLEDAGHMFAASTRATTDALAATAPVGRPRWAKLSAAVGDLPAIAAAARDGGAEAVTLVNTLPAMAIDLATGRPVLGARTGGMSGPALKPVAVRAIHDVHVAFPDLPIVGVGGVTTGEDAVELLLAGASAVQVGTATFADPRAPARVLRELRAWCERAGCTRLGELPGRIAP